MAYAGCRGISPGARVSFRFLCFLLLIVMVFSLILCFERERERERDATSAPSHGVMWRCGARASFSLPSFLSFSLFYPPRLLILPSPASFHHSTSSPSAQRPPAVLALPCWLRRPTLVVLLACMSCSPCLLMLPSPASFIVLFSVPSEQRPPAVLALWRTAGIQPLALLLACLLCSSMPLVAVVLVYVSIAFWCALEHRRPLFVVHGCTCVCFVCSLQCRWCFGLHLLVRLGSFFFVLFALTSFSLASSLFSPSLPPPLSSSSFFFFVVNHSFF